MRHIVEKQPYRGFDRDVVQGSEVPGEWFALTKRGLRLALLTVLPVRSNGQVTDSSNLYKSCDVDTLFLPHYR